MTLSRARAKVLYSSAKPRQRVIVVAVAVAAQDQAVPHAGSPHEAARSSPTFARAFETRAVPAAEHGARKVEGAAGGLKACPLSPRAPREEQDDRAARACALPARCRCYRQEGDVCCCCRACAFPARSLEAVSLYYLCNAACR